MSDNIEIKGTVKTILEIQEFACASQKTRTKTQI